MKLHRFLLLAAACSLPTLAAGDEPAAHETGPVIEETLIVSHPLSAGGLAQPHAVLAGEELDRKVAVSIGATIGSEPGIHNSSFGTAVGRPVIRGLGGARVRVLEDRIDTLDVSVTSGDHAVTVEPLIAERVEILKGPGTLLYGSGAIGGVVDVHTGRIPHDVQSGISGAFDLRTDDNSSGRNGAFRLDGGHGQFAWHLDGFSRHADDYEIPGFTESARQRASEEEAEEEEDHHEEEEPAHGTVPGSGLETLGGAVGFSFIGERGFAGVSISRLETEYGIPGHGHEEEEAEEEEEHHDEEGTPFIDLEQWRLDFEAALVDPLPGFTSLNLRVGVNDYAHQEIEPSGEVAAEFENDAWEGRVELSHGDWAGWRGALGIQYSDREFSVVGEEAFTPPVDTSTLGLFWVGEKSFQGLQLEMGARFDRVDHESPTGGSNDFNGISASIGAVIPLDQVWEAALLADYASRAPGGEELYSNGAHLSVQSFEIGDPDLNKEKALNFSATISGQAERWSVSGTLYRTDFSDFIYQRATGEEREGLVVRQFSQADATFVGWELTASATIAKWQVGQLEISGFFDTVSASLDLPGNDNLPRIPPERIGLGLAFNGRHLAANLDYIHAFRQNDVAEFELPTDSYGDLRAYLGWDIQRNARDGTAITLYLQGRNLTNQEQRQHTSLLKDLASEPGRTIEMGVRIGFQSL